MGRYTNHRPTGVDAADFNRPQMLSALSPHPTLGEINNCFHKDRKRDGGEKAWCDYDSRFKERADYATWALLVHHHDPDAEDGTIDPAGAATKGLAKSTAALRQSDDIIAWGGLAVLMRYLTGIGRFSDQSQPEELLQECYQALSRLTPIAGCYAGCEFIRIFVIAGYQKVSSTLGRSVGGLATNIEHVEEYVNELERLLMQLDRAWLPGTTMSLTRLQEDQRIIVPYAKTDCDRMLANLFFEIRSVIAGVPGTSAFSDRGHRLLGRGAEYARSAWLTHRSNRIGDQRIYFRHKKYGHNKPWFITTERKERGYGAEMRALFRYSQAERDAGNYLEAAKLAYALLEMVPDQIKKKELDWKYYRFYDWFQGVPDQVSWILRQIGVEVPDGFRRDKQATINAKKRKKQSSSQSLDSTKVQGDAARSKGRRASLTDYPGGMDGYEWRLMAEQQSDPLWATVLAVCNEEERSNPHEILKVVVGKWRFGKPCPPEVFQAAYRLALRYGQLSNANWLIKRKPHGTSRSSDPNKRHAWNLTAEDVLAYAAAVASAIDRTPFALDFEVHKFWQKRLRRVWDTVSQFEQFTENELYRLHGVALGCFTSSVRRSPKMGRLVTQKFYSLLTEPRHHRRAADLTAVRQTASNLVQPQWKLVNAIKKLACPEWGSPAVVSVTSIDTHSLSILLVDSSGVTAHRAMTVETPPAGEVKLLLDDKACTIDECGLDWDCAPTCVRIGQQIVQLVNEYAPEAKWIVGAFEPTIASIPWNMLMRQLNSARMVCVVPNLNWLIQESVRPSGTKHPQFTIAQKNVFLESFQAEPEKQERLELMRQTMESDRMRLRYSEWNVAVIAGHGEPLEESGFVTVKAPDRPRGIDDWVALTEFRTLLVHGCLCGAVQKEFVNDLSGIPGLALTLGCRLVVSPVVHVKPETATALQRAITKPNERSTVLMRYHEAMQNCPSVGLYNLYGVGNEVIPYLPR